MTHTVKTGETLSKIAKAHDITLEQLLDANPRFKANPNRVRVGDVLNIPEGRTPSAGPTPQPTPPAPPQPQPPATKALGKLSEKFETGGRGAGTVSGGQGDPGGVSYGSYQMTSKPGGGTVRTFVTRPDFPFRDRFAGLTPGTPQFSAVWKELARTNPEEFQSAQHDFIQRTHFDPLVAKVLRENGLNILTRSATLQDVIWSTAVQHGAASGLPGRALANVSVPADDPSFDRRFIEAIYAERGRKGPDGLLVNFKRASRNAQVKAGLENRFRTELRDALEMLRRETGQ